MNAAAKLSAYGVALAQLVAGGRATGTAVGPHTTAAAASGDHGAMPVVAPPGGGNDHSGTVADAATHQSSRGGYALTPTDTTPTAGSFSFVVNGPEGHPSPPSTPSTTNRCT